MGFSRQKDGIERQSMAPSEKGFVQQRTLKNSISCTGIALHSGEDVSLSLHPADADSGIVFHRSDIQDAAPISALWDRVVDTRLCTVIGNENGVTIGTVEHLMAALAGCGIDNARIDVSGPEVPIMDGSSAPFVELIKEAGVVELSAPRRVIRVKKRIEVEVDGSFAALVPADRQIIDFKLEYDDKVVASQTFTMGLVNGAFCKELARARTFGFLHEVEQMRAAGLAKGGSLENAIVVSHDGVLNEEGLRFDDEFVRHKMLDAIGDLYLAGGTIIGEFSGVRSGHGVNNALLRALFADPDAWDYDVMGGEEIKTAVDGGLSAEPVAVGA